MCWSALQLLYFPITSTEPWLKTLQIHSITIRYIVGLAACDGRTERFVAAGCGDPSVTACHRVHAWFDCCYHCCVSRRKFMDRWILNIFFILPISYKINRWITEIWNRDLLNRKLPAVQLWRWRSVGGCELTDSTGSVLRVPMATSLEFRVVLGFKRCGSAPFGSYTSFGD